MKNKNPPFEITAYILEQIAEIAELVGRVNALPDVAGSPTLRRTNRIRSVHGSLAIEQNSLSLEQVTALLNGRRVLAPPRDIAEVKNAFEIYDMLPQLNPYSVEDLLKAHGVMTRGLQEESGCFRSGAVGVVDGDGNILHFGTLPAYVPGAVSSLLTWAEEADFHMLVKSCVFHYELELIHPFADGNGRVGRLWHSLLLSKWKPIFAWLPVESIIHDRQEEYYAAINRSNAMAESTVFIEFMLEAIKEALAEVAGTADAAEYRRTAILRFLEKHGRVTNADVRRLFGVSPATANRILSRMVSSGELKKVRAGRSWEYEQ